MHGDFLAAELVDHLMSDGVEEGDNRIVPEVDDTFRDDFQARAFSNFQFATTTRSRSNFLDYVRPILTVAARKASGRGLGGSTREQGHGEQK